MATSLFVEQVTKEMLTYEALFKPDPKDSTKWLQPLETFGHPLAACVVDGVTYEEKPARYTFWPLNKDKMPLLFVAATIILSVPATSTSNEGFHSVVTLLLRPNRRSLSKKKVQAYSLMRASLGSMLKSKFGSAVEEIEKEALASGYLDVGEVRRVLGLEDMNFDDDVDSVSDSCTGGDNELIDLVEAEKQEEEKEEGEEDEEER
jgi:hypothetical protein